MLSLENQRFAYAQFVCAGWHAPFMRVLPGIFDQPIDEINVRELTMGSSLFRTQFAIDHAVGRRHGRVVARLPVPAAESSLPPLRIGVRPSSQSPHGWRIVDPSIDGPSSTEAEFLSRYPDAQLEELPLWDIPLFPTLSWMIEVQWTPRLAHGASLGLPERPSVSAHREERSSVKSRPRRTTYLASFVSLLDANVAGEAAQAIGMSAEVEKVDDRSGNWLLIARHRGRPSLDFERSLQRIVTENRGHYEGNIFGLFK